MATESDLDIGRRLRAEVLELMKQTFVGKDEVIDLLGVCLAGGENLFILGPPGTAKSALVHNLAGRLEGRTFDYLLTRFTEPNELFGPFDIRKLRDGELITNTEGMLPEASMVFLDELLNANSAILNSLLTALNERIFRRGKECRPLQALMFVGASNHLPEDEALLALFDRFLLRVHCDNVPVERLSEVLDAGWRLNHNANVPSSLHFDDIKCLQKLVLRVDLNNVRTEYAGLIQRIRQAGISVSDRRAVKLQRLVAASAIVSGRMQARLSDFWVLKYIWDTEMQQEVLAALVQDVIGKGKPDPADHVRVHQSKGPDPENLARELDHIDELLSANDTEGKSYLRDRLGLLEGRCQWIGDADKREFLNQRVSGLWNQLNAVAES